jgi:hypothetical protein
MAFKKGQLAWNKGIHINLNPNGGFKKGMIPYNKGIKTGRVPKSAFKSGFIPWNKGLLCRYVTERNLLNNPGGKLKDHWNWQGGITKIYFTIRRMKEYLTWRNSVLERDNRICKSCKDKTKRVVVHHIKSFARILHEYKIMSRDEARNCKILWDITNGECLCKDCHSKTDSYGFKKYKITK